MFPSKSFMVSHLTFEPFIHFEFTLVSGVRQQSSFILLNVDIPFSKYRLLKKLPFFPCIFGTLVEDQLTVYALIYFWIFESISLVHESIFMPLSYSFDYNCFAIWFEIRMCYASSFVLYILHVDYFYCTCLAYHHHHYHHAQNNNINSKEINGK